jgi:phospholipase/carboxylesterase
MGTLRFSGGHLRGHYPACRRRHGPGGRTAYGGVAKSAKIRAMDDAIVIETGPRPVAAVIWLHGLGADGHDFEPVVPELRLATPVRFVFPNAPLRAVTINNGMRMRAWYDIFQFGGGREDEKGIRDSQARVEQLMAAERKKGIEKIVLAGFSQGGAIVLQAALRQKEPLAGVMALSTYLPLAATVAQERTPESLQTPLFMAHGQFDDLIGIDRARQSREMLEKSGYRIEWHDYPMPHSVCMEEIADIAAFLRKVFA